MTHPSRSALAFCLALFLLCINFGLSTTRIFPNGTTIIDSRGDLRFRTKSSEAHIELEDFQFNANHVTALHGKDFHVSAAGNNVVLEASELQFMCPLETANITTASKNLRLVHGIGGFVEIDNLKFGGHILNSKSGNIVVAPSDYVEMRTTKIIGDPLSSDYFNLTSKSSHLKLGTENEGDILLDAGENHSVKIVASRLDLLGAALNLTGTHVTLDQIISQSLLINGTLITTTDSDVDIILSPKGSGFVRVGSGKMFDVSSATLVLRDDQISGDKVEGGVINAIQINTLSTDTLTSSGSTVTLAAGKTFDVSSGVLELADGQISGDKIEGGTVGSIKINNLTATFHSGMLSAGKTLDVSTGTLILADNQISGNKIEGGVINAIQINTLTSGEVAVDNVKIDSNTVQAVSGDLNLQCPAGSRVKVGDTLQIGKLVMSGNTLNSTDHTTIVLSPHGLGAVKVAEGKTLDLRGVTLMIDDDAIKRMDNVTINELVGHLIKSGMLTISGETISSTGDIRLRPAGGKLVKITEPLEVEKIVIDTSTIGTTTGQPVTINNLTCPVATFNKVTVGSLQIEDNEVSCIGATCDIELSAAGTGDVVLKSDVLLGAGKSITGTTSEATFQSVKTSTVSTTSGDLTLNPAGQNVKISASKTLDVTGATLKVDDDSISGDKIEGGTVDQIEVKNLRSDEVSVSGRVQVNGSVEVGSGGVESMGGVRDSHAWSSENARRAKLALALNSGGLGSSAFTGSPLSLLHFSTFDISSVNVGFHGAVYDGRFIIFVPKANGVFVRYDTQGEFSAASSWNYYDVGASTDNEYLKDFVFAAFDGRYLYASTYTNPSCFVVRYDSRGDFTVNSSWVSMNVTNVNGNQNVKGFISAIFVEKSIIFVPVSTWSTKNSGLVLRYEVDKVFTDSSSWTTFDASNINGQDNIRGYYGAASDGHYTYFAPYDDGPGGRHGRILRWDESGNFSSPSSWTSFDISNVNGQGNVKGFHGATFDGRFVYFVPWNNALYHAMVVRYDTAMPFNAISSYSVFDPSPSVGKPGLGGFIGAVFDGRYVNFVPFYGCACFLRYDTTGTFDFPESWRFMDVSSIEGLQTVKGYAGGTFDGRYIYYAPYYDGVTHHGYVLRYDTRSPEKRPSLAQIASNKDIFISSNSNVGIGTTSPTTKLDIDGSVKVSEKIGIGISTPNNPSTELEVKGTARIDKVEVQESLSVGGNTTEMGNGEAVRVEGGLMASGGVRDSHAWSSESVRRAKLTLALNSGGYGSSVFVGGNKFSIDDCVVYDVSNVGTAASRGYYGAATDGRYVYFSPYFDGSNRHGRVLRFDTQREFDSQLSWRVYDAGSTSGLNTKGYAGTVFDGRYLYFVPSYNGQYHGYVLRYDSQALFDSSSSWLACDATATSPGDMMGFNGGVFDGRFIYFVPATNHVRGWNGRFLRFDTLGDFLSSSSWTGYDAGSTSGLSTKGYNSGVFDGRYIYFCPYYDGTSRHARVLRLDTSGAFDSVSSWTAYDAGNTDGVTTVGYIGGTFDGRFIYFSPYETSPSNLNGRVLRLDTNSPFRDPSSWNTFDAKLHFGVSGYQYASYDGRYVYFWPWQHATILRLDTQFTFADSASWNTLNVTGVGGSEVGYRGGAFDGRYFYLAPDTNGDNYHGRALRYDTRSPQSRPSLTQIATSSELFIASNGSIGIGTTNPGSEKLTVEGGVLAKGGVRDSHAWASGSVKDAKLVFEQSGGSHYLSGEMEASRFSAYDASSTNGLETKTFTGSVFDGRYMYFVSGIILRYDTQGVFGSPSSWTARQTSTGNTNGAYLEGFIYFAPYNGVSLRYNTRLEFHDPHSWTSYDARNVGGLETKGYVSVVTDGRYLYYAPQKYQCSCANNGYVLRYDSFDEFTSSSSWSVYDVSNSSGVVALESNGACFDGRFVYMPGRGSSAMWRYDTSMPFSSPSSWQSRFTSIKEQGECSFDGRFVYWVSANGASSAYGSIERFDTKAVGGFSDASSWQSRVVPGMMPDNWNGFGGTVYDGAFIYLAPLYSSYPTEGYGFVVRYDPSEAFMDSTGWKIIDVSNTSAMYTKMYSGAVTDGRFLYFVPGLYGSDPPHTPHGHILRYDTRSPLPRPSIQQIASNKDLFIASDGKVGIGTTSPTEKLHVEGNIKAVGTISATSTCCSSDIRLKSNITSLTNSLSTIKQIRSIRYIWKKNGEPSIGFVAQELEEVVPEVVVTGSDGYKAVDYGKLSAVLVSGIQEMEENSERMESEIAELKQKHEVELKELRHEMNSRLEKLEKIIDTLI